MCLQKKNLTISYFLTETSILNFKIKDNKSKEVVKIYKREIRRKIGQNEETISLDRIKKLSENTLLFDHNDYELIIEASATYSSRNYFTREKITEIVFKK